jgi:chemotaxis protein MotB
MVKSVSSAWLWFFGLFLIIFSFLATGLFIKHRKTSIRLSQYQDTLATYKELYTDLKQKYIVLNNKYEIAIRSAIQGNKLISEKQQQLIQMERVLKKQDSILNEMKDRIKQVMVGYKNDKFDISVRNGKLYVTLREKLLFPLGSAQVQPEGIRALGKVAKILNQDTSLTIIIEGHTDNIPIKPGTKCWKDNWDLSAARAISVARILINKYGVSPERITIAGRAQYDPVASNLTARGRALNRRIEIVVVPNMAELYKIIEQ